MENNEFGLGHVTLEMSVKTSKWRYQVSGWRKRPGLEMQVSIDGCCLKLCNVTLLNSRAL